MWRVVNHVLVSLLEFFHKNLTQNNITQSYYIRRVIARFLCDRMKKGTNLFRLFRVFQKQKGIKVDGAYCNVHLSNIDATLKDGYIIAIRYENKSIRDNILKINSHYALIVGKKGNKYIMVNATENAPTTLISKSRMKNYLMPIIFNSRTHEAHLLTIKKVGM